MRQGIMILKYIRTMDGFRKAKKKKKMFPLYNFVFDRIQWITKDLLQVTKTMNFKMAMIEISINTKNSQIGMLVLLYVSLYKYPLLYPNVITNCKIARKNALFSFKSLTFDKFIETPKIRFPIWTKLIAISNKSHS